MNALLSFLSVKKKNNNNINVDFTDFKIQLISDQYMTKHRANDN